MNAPPKIPTALRESQVRAANPDASVFVSANAGSGKTWVLTQRVIKLLLQGSDLLLERCFFLGHTTGNTRFNFF